MTDEQLLKMQGWTDENIMRLKAIVGNPEAHQYAMKTNDLNGAFAMTQKKEESGINLNEWFGSFSDAQHEDAKSLSIALTKFARFIQSEVDKKKAP